jgi:hypothetical protein
VRTTVIALILMTVSHFGVPSEPHWQTVEEVLAVVGNTPILHSDLELAALVQIIEAEDDEAEEAYRSRLLEARIRLEIEFRDLEDGGILYRLNLDPEPIRNLLITRGGGEETLASNLHAAGLDWPDLDELVLRVAATEAFVEQRLRPNVSVSMEEIEAAYQQLLVTEIAGTDEPLPSLTTVSDHLRRILVERKVNEEIERWLQRAKERHEVIRFAR